MTKLGGSGVNSTTQVKLMLLPLFMKTSGPPKMFVFGSEKNIILSFNMDKFD